MLPCLSWRAQAVLLYCHPSKKVPHEADSKDLVNGLLPATELTKAARQKGSSPVPPERRAWAAALALATATAASS